MEISAVNTINFQAQQLAPVDPRSPEIRAEKREVVKAVGKLNETSHFGERNELTFLLDRQTGRPVVRVIDKKTREVIQQFPPEYVLRLADELELSR
jgi:flagellar protein FlaG